MNCQKCGAEMKGKFCSSCGASQEGYVQTIPTRPKNKRVMAGIVSLIVISILLLVWLLWEDNNPAIATVRDGYLGEYTFQTVGEVLDATYSPRTGVWDGGTTDDGRELVDVRYGEGADKVIIQFEMLDDKAFKLAAFVDPQRTIEKHTGAMAELNNMYLTVYRDQHQEELADLDVELEMIKWLDGISGASVLYGASADYTGDRAQLYKLWGEDSFKLSVPWLLDAYGYLEYTSTYYFLGAME